MTFLVAWYLDVRTLVEYNPKSAEELAAAREKRERKKVERARQEILRQQRQSLFPEMFDDVLLKIANS